MTSFPDILKAAALALLVATGVSSHAPARAGEQPNLLVVGEDADEDTVPRNSRVFNRVLAALSSEMAQQGFKVYDETAVAMGINLPNRIRRVDAELITVGAARPAAADRRRRGVPIYASVQQNPYADILDLMLRISGPDDPGADRPVPRQFRGGVRAEGPAAAAAALQPRLPLLEHIGEQAKRVAHDLGSVLAEKLSMLSPARQPTGPSVVTAPAPIPQQTDGAPPPAAPRSSDCTGMTTGYALVFRGFEFAGGAADRALPRRLQRLRPSSPRPHPNRFVEYWYETCIDVARLDRNIQLMLEQMALTGRTALRGNRIEVDKIAAPITR